MGNVGQQPARQVLPPHAGRHPRLDSLVYGVPTSDPATFAGASVLLLLVAATASVVPALRLLALDPVEALREE